MYYLSIHKHSLCELGSHTGFRYSEIAMEVHNPESVRPFQMRAALWNCIEKIDLSVSIQVVEPLLLDRWCHTEKGYDQAKMRKNTTIEKISDLPHKELWSIIRPNTEVVRREGCEFCIRVGSLSSSFVHHRRLWPVR